MHGHRDIVDLTAIRALFALWVLIYHIDLHTGFSGYLGVAGNLLQHGYLGVDGFFILSGLILATTNMPELPEPGVVGSFYGRRLARIYPLHLATIVLLAALFLAGRAAGISPNDPSRFSGGALIANLLLVQGWGFVNHWAWNYPSWSLSTEFAGYLVFPWLWYGVALMRFEIAATLGIVMVPVVGLIEYSTPAQLNLTFGLSFVRFFPEFIWGMLLARMVGPTADIMPGKAVLIPALVFVGLGVLLGVDVMVVIGLAMLLLGLAMRDVVGWKPIMPPVLQWLGVLSYALYMSFCPAELIVSQGFRHYGLDPAQDPFLFTFAMGGLTLLLAIVLHATLERPARAWFAARLVAKPVVV